MAVTQVGGTIMAPPCNVQRRVLQPRTMRYISHAHINRIDNPPQGLHP